MKQIKSSYWLFNYQDRLKLQKGKTFLLALIDRCLEIPQFKEVQLKLYEETEFGLIEDDHVLPGFLLSPSLEQLRLEEEIGRTSKYLLHKYLLPKDNPEQKINTGRYTYQITQITIESVNQDGSVELIVECSRKSNKSFRQGMVDFFLNETLPILEGSYAKPRLKALTEFERLFVQTNTESFKPKAERSEKNDANKRAYRATHTLEQALINNKEPKTFQVYPAGMIKDKTGMFNGDITLYDLNRELFNTETRFRIKNIYETDFAGSKEAKEFKKEQFLERMISEDRKFYEKQLNRLNAEYFLGSPLQLRITSEVKLIPSK